MSQRCRHEGAATDLERFARLIVQRLGIRADVGDLRASLDERIAETGAASGSTYVETLERRQATDEWSVLARRLTVPETYFFRNSEHWKALVRHVIPGILDQQSARAPSLRIWSAGCSTGEEPYTIAMVLAEMGLSKLVRAGAILATDLLDEALAAGKRAAYQSNSFRSVSKGRIEKFFHHDGDLLTVNDEIRNAVTYRLLNLADPMAVAAFVAREGPFQIVFCRNVLIYFAPRVCSRLLDQLADALAPDGTLFLGHSEFPHMWTDSLESVPVADTFVFRKRHGDGRRECVEEWSETTAEREAYAPLERASADAVCEPARSALPTSRIPCAPRSTESPTEVQPSVEASGLEENTTSGLWSEVAQVLEQSRRGQDADAVSASRRLVDRNGLSPEAHYALGVALEMAGETPNAVDAYRNAVFLDAGFAQAHWRLAQVLGVWRRRDRAISEARWAVRMIADESETRLRHLSGIDKPVMTRMMEHTLEWLRQQQETDTDCAAS